MTDKELEKKAEQYSSKYARQYYHNDKSGFTTSEEEVCKAYIAGEKENGVILHDLRKSPNDLPESSIFNEVLNENGTKVYYDNVNKAWYMFSNNIIIRANTPKFWCEIPKFEEK